MKKKSIAIILVIILLVTIAVVVFFVLKNNKYGYHVLSNDKQEKAIKVGISEDKGFRIEKDETKTGVIEFWNDEVGYRIEVALRDMLQSTYETNLERHREDKGFNEIVINKFKGYEYSSVSFGRHMYLNLGVGKSGLYDIIYVYVGRTEKYNEGIEDILKLEEVKSILKTLKVVEYVVPDEIVDNDKVKVIEE